MALSLHISPSGSWHLDASELDGAAETRIAQAWRTGLARGLLHLGFAEIAAPLDPTLAFARELARLFLTHLCHVPDLEEARERLTISPPADALFRLASSAPPMRGGEYLTVAALEQAWREMESTLRDELTDWTGSVESYLRERSPVWNLVGRVHLNLAENKDDPDHPFAFLATYTTRVSQAGRVVHRQLGQAVRESGAARDRAALVALLAPVERAAARSALLKELLDAGELFHPVSWTPKQAHRLLLEAPALEEAGLVVRVPDWWKARRPARPEVTLRIGNSATTLGADQLLNFEVSLTLDGDPLSEREWRALRASTEGLALVRGRWVEIDREKLDAVLAHWKSAERAAQDGVSFAEAMRLLAGIQKSGTDALPEDERGWTRVVAGGGLARALESLRSPEGIAAARPGRELRATLRPYQETGASWLWHLQSLGLGGCLADDMGLGKTIQILALLLLLKRQDPRRTHLLVVPASLVDNWLDEIVRFTPSLEVLVAHPSSIPKSELESLAPDRIAAADVVITTYATVPRLRWMAETRWDTLVLDEAQAIKNPGAKQTRAVKALRARVRLALTGTPVENRIGDLWSIFDFINPGLLGSASEFARLGRELAQRGDYAPLRTLVRPYILRRLKTDERVIADLPEKTELRVHCGLSKIQAVHYQEAVDALAQRLRSVNGIERRGVVLAFLMRFKQICNHPSHWLGDGAWAPEASGKFARLAELAETIADKQEKALFFTQFREVTEPLAAYLATLFGRRGLVLHGNTPVKERKGLVHQFQSDDEVPFFVLSVKAGGTGLNLTAASHVIHFDRWWNPAVEDQATDRAFRIGQKKNVLVHKLVCRGTVEERIDVLIEGKRGLSRELLDGDGGAILTELGDRELLELVSLDIHRALAER